MNSEQERLYELLDDIDSVCKKRGVIYYLIGEELLWGSLNKNNKRFKADICMTFSAYKKIADDLQNIKNRVIEDIHSNPDMPGAYYRFADTDSLMMELSYHKVIKEFGIAVNIHIIRKRCLKSEELEKLELAMDSDIEGVRRSISPEDKKKLLYLKKNKDYADKIEGFLEECSLKEEDFFTESVLKLPSLEAMVFPPGFWSGNSYVMIKGRRYLTVCNKENYLDIHYEHPERVIAHDDSFMNRVIADTSISYREVYKDLLDELDDEDFWESRRNLYDEYFGKYDKLLALRKELDIYMNAIAERIFLWKRYMPNKQNIVRLFEDRRLDELQLVFTEMEKSIKKYEKYNFLCVFDKEIWDIYTDVLKIEGEKARVEQLDILYKRNPFKEPDSEELSQYENNEKKKLRRIL